MTSTSPTKILNPPNHILFNSSLWKPALEKYAVTTRVTVQLFDTNLRVVLGPIHHTPLFDLFHGGGYDPGLFAECARQCLVQTTERPAVTVSKVHGLAVVGTSLVLDGNVVGAAVAGYVLVDFSQLSEIQRVAKDGRLDFARLWQVAREQSPVPQQRLNVHGELLQVLGDALLRENARTRQYENAALELREAGRAKEDAYHKLQQTASVLRESEERYHTLFDLDPIAVYSCDASGVIQDYNHVAVELWGREPRPGDTDERWCGSFKMLRPDGTVMEHGQCPMADVLSGKVSEVHDAEVQIERPDGSRVTVLVNIRPLKNAKGEIAGAINCFVDITERKRGEEGRTRLASIVESSDDAMISKTLDGTITSWNRGAEDLFGYTAEEAIGHNIRLIIPSERLPEEETILQQLRRGERIDHFETQRRRKDGALLDISLTISPLKDAAGRVVGASKVARDISDRKANERALREAHDRLELMVEERTASVRQLSLKLLTVQDEEHRRIARELHDSVGQHLASIKMTVDRLQRLESPKEQAEMLPKLSESLDLCMAETRTISYLLHPPLIDELGFTAAAKWFVDGFSKRSSIEVNLQLPSKSQRLPRSIELPLFRILQASLSNVHRHAHSPSADVRFEFDKEQAKLEVKDYGKGIDPEVLGRFRGNGTGTGIGLAGMRERLRELGGRLEVESDANGTLVRAVIPVSTFTDAETSRNAA